MHTTWTQETQGEKGHLFALAGVMLGRGGGAIGRLVKGMRCKGRGLVVDADHDEPRDLSTREFFFRNE